MFSHPLCSLKNNSLLVIPFLVNFIIGLPAAPFKIMHIVKSKEILKQNFQNSSLLLHWGIMGLQLKVSHSQCTTFIQDEKRGHWRVYSTAGTYGHCEMKTSLILCLCKALNSSIHYFSWSLQVFCKWGSRVLNLGTIDIWKQLLLRRLSCALEDS
jgi:hypothetical protein